jgi:hypothetical protein
VWWSAPRFYFVNRNRSKFKFELNSNEFVNYKGFRILERNAFSLFGFGPKSSLILEFSPAAIQLPAEPWPGKPASAVRTDYLVWTCSANSIQPDSKDMTQIRPKSKFIPIKTVRLNWVLPSSDFSLSASFWNRFWDRLVRISNPLHVGIKTPINSALFCSNFRSQTVAPAET